MTYCTDTLLANIAEGYEVTFAAGKTSSTTNLLRGVIESITIEEGGPNFMKIHLSGPDFGSSILNHTVVKGAWVQQKEADGVTLDDTDDNVLIYNIIDDMISNADRCYIVPTDGITAETKGLNAVSATYCKPPNKRLAQFFANSEFIGDKLREMDDEFNTIHYVDFSKNLVVQSPALTSSGILLVDKTDDAVAATWDTTKLGYLVTTSYEKTLESHRKRLYGYGGDQRLDHAQQKQTTTTTFTKNDTSWLAMKFMPYYTNIATIYLYLDKVGDPGNANVLFIVNDSSGNPSSSTLKTMTIDAASVTGTAGWHHVDLNEDGLNTEGFYWIVLQETGDASNYYRWYRTNGSTSYTTATSSDGITWSVTSAGDGFAYRAYSTSPLMVPMPSAGLAASDKHFYEEVIRKPDITEIERMLDALNGVHSIANKRKEILRANVYAPDALLQTNQTVRVRKQAAGHTFDSLGNDFVIGEITYRFDTSQGYLYQDVELVRYVAYP